MTIPQIHDRLFRNVFGDRHEAAALLRPHLPAPLADALNWSTLSLLNRSYIDDDARASELDLLFTIERSTDEAPLALYVLLEHQSQPNRYMRLRLLKYCCRIWEQAEQESGRLRAIVPVVLYQGRRRWPWPTELSELFAPVEQQWPWTPHFAHLLIDQSQAAGQHLGGGSRGQIALLALMAAYRQGHEQLQLALRVVRLLAALPPTGRFDIVKLFVTYLLQTQDEAHLPRLSEEWRRRAPEAGGDFVTIAEMLIKQGRQEGRVEGRQEGHQEGRAEGRQEGRQEGRVEGRQEGHQAGRVEGRQEGHQEGRLDTLEQLARAGVEWPLIESAAGDDSATLRVLKERLRSNQTNGDAASDQPSPPAPSL